MQVKPELWLSRVDPIIGQSSREGGEQRMLRVLLLCASIRGQLLVGLL